MTEAFIRRRDMDFLLKDWLGADGMTTRASFADHTPETFSSVVDLAEKVAAKSFAPHYKKADQNEPRFENGKVILIPEIEAALRAFAESGFFAGPFPSEFGGMQLPNVVSAASMAYFMAANIATAAYPMLTMGNAHLLIAHGNAAQIEAFAMPEIEGRFFGTMCLSEPQAGSSLSDITTSASAEGEDALGTRYRISGTKMWISGAEHDMSENIVHLVLAKVKGPDGQLPSGVKGISLFVVPRILPDGSRNDVTLTGLNHKMGYRGTVNCLLQFGEHGGATGWRIGEEGQGLAIMFHMMNEARIMVGLGAAALAYRGYQQSLSYARERPQGRHPAKAGEKPVRASQVPIVEHADVRRMLIAQKAFAEGALALVLFSASLVDDEKTHPDATARHEAHELLDLLTPVTKSWPSEFGLVANDLAIQIHGGSGYTRDFDVEQIYRDNRLNPIHEGTYGIQAIDLVGRKLSGNGAALDILERRIGATAARARTIEPLAPLADQLETTWQTILRVIQRLAAEPDRARRLANASRFLTAFGHTVVGWIWLDMAATANALPSGSEEEEAFKSGKLRACRYFFNCELPMTAHWLALVESFDDSAWKLKTEEF